MTIKLNGSTAGSVALDAPASTTGNADINFKLPVADGSANQVIKTDGSGNLGFVSQANWVHGTETALNGNNVVIENGVPDGASHIRYLLRYVSVSGGSGSSQPFIQVELNNNGTIKNSNYLGSSLTFRNLGTQVQGDSDKTDGLTLWYGYTHGGNTLFGVVDIYRIGTNGSDGTNYIINFQGFGNSASSGYDAVHQGQAYFELGTGSTDYVSGLRLSSGSSTTFDNGYIQQSYLLS